MNFNPDIEQLNIDFNLGRVAYQGVILYSYTENDVTWYGAQQDLIDTFGVMPDDLDYGYFFERKVMHNA